MSRITRRTVVPVNQITPLTYRDGVTYIQMLTELSEYVKSILHPSLQHTVDELVSEVEKQMDQHHDQYVEGVQEFQRIHDAFMSDVNASLIALNDGAVSDLVKDETSRLGEVLRELFPSHEVLDTTVTAVRNEMSLLESQTNETISTLSDTVDDNADEIHGRLSQHSLEASFDTRARLNTKVVDGSTPYERLANAVSTGEPVQFDEHIEHTGNIDGFWDTTIYGTGTITTPDGGVFHVEPVPNTSEMLTNTIYVHGQTGHQDNDGLTPDTALDTLTTVYRKVLTRLTAQQRSGARWVIRLSGELVDGVTYYYDLGDYKHGLSFEGDPLVNNRPVTVIRKISTSASRPFWIEPGVDSIEFHNLHFIGWSGTYGYGVYMRFGGELTVQNCEFSDGQYGAAAVQNVVFRMNDNRVNDSMRTGFLASYNSTGQFNRNEMYGGANSRYGVEVTRNTVSHVDDNYFEGWQQSAVMVDMASRASVDRNTFEANNVGVITRGAAEWSNNSNTFYGTNTTAYEHQGGGRERRMHSEGSWTGTEYRLASTNHVYGSSQLHELSGWKYIYRGNTAGRLQARWFQSRGKYIRVLLHGHTDTAGTLIEFGTDGDDVSYALFGRIAIPSSGYFTVDTYIYATGTATQRTHLTAHGGEGSVSTANTSNISFNNERRMVVRASGNGHRLTTFNMQVFTLG
jgi:hypothetical protein